MRRYFLFLALGVVLASAPAHAIEYGGLGGVPANPDPSNPRSNSIFIYTLAQGASKQDGVRVVNNSSETKTIEVYATDSEVASGGSFACTQKSDRQKSVGTWIQFEKSELTLPTNTEEVINFRIKVPEGASVGEHNGCIVIQEKDAASAETGNNVQLSFRSALRTVVTVPGDITKDINFSNLLIKSEAKKYIITAQLLNTGNVSLDTDIQVLIKDLFGRKVYQNGGVYPLLAQKQPVELNFEYPKPFWGGIFRVSGTAAYNGDPAAPLGVKSDNNVVKHAPSKLLLVMPHPLAAALELLLLLLIIIGAWLTWRKLQRRRRQTIAWRPYTVRQGDTLPNLAARARVSWKLLARANKLRAPYELRPGTTIKLPFKSNKQRK